MFVIFLPSFIEFKSVGIIPSLKKPRQDIEKVPPATDHIFPLKHIDLYCFAFSGLLLITVWYMIQFGGMDSGTDS